MVTVSPGWAETVLGVGPSKWIVTWSATSEPVVVAAICSATAP